MIRRLSVALFALAATPAAAGTVSDACNQARFAAPSACDCMQSVADEHLSAQDQALYVDVVTQRRTIRDIAASEGLPWTEAFTQRIDAFATDSNARCGVP